MNAEKQKAKIHFPKVGQRIIRSVVAVACCFCVFYLRDKEGIPFILHLRYYSVFNHIRTA